MYRKAVHLAIGLFLVFVGICSLHINAFAQDKGAGSPPMVPVLGTQLLTIHSTILDRDFELHVNLPRFYSDTTRKFPVLYLMDSQWDFPLVNAVFGEQYYDGFVPEIVIVGIAPAGTNPNYDSLRAMDLTPTRMAQQPQTGGGPKFLQFIKKEAIPFIESKYRVKGDDRALMGSSLGGLFTLYAMFTETAVFNRYILTSPALQWDNGVLFTYEKEYAAKNTRLPVRLFMGRAELEPGDADFQKLVDLLKSRNYAGLDLHTAVAEGMGHSGGKSLGYPRGLQAVYARPTVTLEPAQLDPYVGSYQVAPQVVVTINREGHQLVLTAPDGTKLPFVASTETDFFMKGTYLFLHFEKDGSGKVKGAKVDQFTGSAFFDKVK